MFNDSQPGNVPELVRSAHFPVYGLTDHPDGFSTCGISTGYFGEPLKLSSISFTYSSPHYPEKRDNLVVSSIDASTEQQGNIRIVYDLKDPSEGRLFDLDTNLFQHYRLGEKEQTQIGHPSIWEGTLSIAGVTFLAKTRHWSSSHLLSLFLLKSEKTILSGQAYGPSHENLLQLLQALQIINHQEDLLKRYQSELDQETR